MSTEVLSQSEIDDLLSALSTGTVTAEEIKIEQIQKKIKVYDFKRPDKFSKDQIRTLFMLHENFARIFNTYLSANLRTMVSLEVVSVDQLTYEEFIRSLSNPSVINIFKMHPLKGNAILEINSHLVLALVDRLFGGLGSNQIKPRPLTDIETAIIKRVIDKALDSLQEAWKQVVKLEPKSEVIETNPQFTQIVPPNDMVVLITLKAKIGQTEGLMNICIPYLVVEPIMSKLTTTYWVASSITKTTSEESVAALQKKLERAPIPIVVELGNTNINVGELITLEVGDVLELNRRLEDDLSIIIGTKEKYKCKAGLMGKKIAVQISKVLTEGDENND